MADGTPLDGDGSSGLGSRPLPDRTLLTPGQRSDLTARLPGWEIEGDHLRRTFTFADFAGAWTFMGSVAAIAESLQHHPDWSNSWNRVEIAVTTHSAGGLTHLDVAFAEETMKVAEEVAEASIEAAKAAEEAAEEASD